jgi:hypothetical protein
LSVQGSEIWIKGLEAMIQGCGKVHKSTSEGNVENLNLASSSRANTHPTVGSECGVKGYRFRVYGSRSMI